MNTTRRMCDWGGRISPRRIQKHSATTTAETWAGWAQNEKNERKPQRTTGSDPSYHILAGAVQSESLFSISLFGKRQSSTKPIRSNDLSVETDIQQLKLRLTHLSGNHSHFPLFFTLVSVLLQKKAQVITFSHHSTAVSIISPKTIQTAPFKEKVTYFICNVILPTKTDKCGNCGTLVYCHQDNLL